MNNDNYKSWERLLNPDSLKTNLLTASIYLAAFEMLKTSIIERIETFFMTGFNEKGFIIDKEYKTDVLSRNKSPVYASLNWLQERKAIDSEDIENFDKMKDFRNDLAHELTKFITEDKEQDYIKYFQLMTILLDKIEKWWIVNFEIPINPDYDNKEIDENAIISGPSIMLHIIVNVALGKEEDSKYYYDKFKNLASQASSSNLSVGNYGAANSS